MLKIVFLFISFFISPIYGFSFDINNISFNNIDNTILYILYIAVALIVLLLILLFYKKSRSKRVNRVTQADFFYLKNVNNTLLKEFFELTKTLTPNPAVKNILNRLKEMDIFLSVQTDSIRVQRGNFNLEEFINQISQELSTKEKNLNIITNSNLSYSVITDKHILEAIITLLAFLQFQEHNLKNAYIRVDLYPKEKKLTLKIDEGLSFNKYMQKVLEDAKLTPFYNEKENFYYGLYLFLVNKLVAELNGVLRINILDKVYTLAIELPVSIERKEGRTNFLIHQKSPKEIKALIICDDESLANSVAHFLTLYDINTDIITDNKIIQLPSFLEYDLLISNKKFLNTIFADYLINIKKHHLIKVVAIEDLDDDIEYKEDLVDIKIQKPIVQSKIYAIVVDLLQALEKSNNETLQQQIVLNKKKRRKDKKVLVADDNVINRNLLKVMIENYGLEVITVSNGQEVLEVLEKEKDNIGLVIVDSIMPKLDAYETVQKIREKEEFNAIPVVIHSSFSLNGAKNSIDDIFKLGFDSYLPKPFTVDKLESILRRYLHVKALVLDKKEINTQEYEEFIAIYGNSDKMIEKYIKEGNINQLKVLLDDLKNIAQKIKKEKLYNEVVSLQEYIKTNQTVTLDTVTPLIRELTIAKYEVIKSLEY